jgi:biotin transport system substrate-specific component
MNKTHILDNSHEIINDRAVNAMIGAAFFILATALGSYVRVPVIGSPVPITLQTFFVLLSGAVLGKKLGLFSQAAYLGLSLPFIAGPTGGYFAGFAIASYVIGRMLENKDAPVWHVAASFALGIGIIYTCGVSWLVYMYKMSLPHAIGAGALPFIAGDAIKIVAASAIYLKIAKRAGSIFSA